MATRSSKIGARWGFWTDVELEFVVIVRCITADIERFSRDLESTELFTFIYY